MINISHETVSCTWNFPKFPWNLVAFSRNNKTDFIPLENTHDTSRTDINIAGQFILRNTGLDVHKYAACLGPNPERKSRIREKFTVRNGA